MDVIIAPRRGLRLCSPVMTASGTFGYGIEFASRGDLTGLGAVVCKGTTREPRAGHAPVRLIETAAGMVNAIGLQNVGVDGVVREKAPAWTALPVPVLVNVSAMTLEDYVYVVERLNGVPGIAGVELNISCPNTDEGGAIFGVDAQSAADATAAARGATDLPLVVKLSPQAADIRSVAAAVEEAGADAVSLINTVPSMAIDVTRRTPALANVSGGLSGPAVKPIALHQVYQVAQTVTMPVVGIGGIMTASDALEFLLAGAAAVQMGTALLVDPFAWRAVVEGIEEWCRSQGVRRIEEIVGAANPHFKGGRQREAGGLRTAGLS